MEQILANDFFSAGIFPQIAFPEAYPSMLSFLIACFLSVISIPIIINMSNLLNLTAKPGFRSSHTSATPTLGGIAIFASTLLSFFLWPHLNEPQDTTLIGYSMVGLIMLFFLGLKDDILALDSTKKLMVQIAAAMTLVLLGNFKVDYLFGIFGWFFISDWISIPLTIMIFIAITNSINLIDGIDGLAGGISLIASLGFGFWFLLNEHYAFACLAFALSGSLLGFLRFNFSKTSKIFMGDTGSLVVGFLLSFFSVAFIRLNISYRHDPAVFFNAPIIVMVLLIVPIFDTLRVFIVRILKGKSPFIADRNHMHHILLDNGMNHFWASFTLWCTTIVNMLLFFRFHGSISNTMSLYIYIALFFVYLFASFILKQRARALKYKKLSPSDKKFSIETPKLSATKRILKNL